MKVSCIALSLAALASSVYAYPTASANGSCLDFGLASEFGAVIFGDYSGSSDVQGKLAVQGNGDFKAGFSVADQVQGADCSQYTTIVGQKLTWPRGRNYFGKIAVGDETSDIDTGVLEGCEVVLDTTAFDFEESYFKLDELSASLGNLTSTVKSMTVSESLALTLELSGEHYEVVDVPANYIGGNIKEILAPKGVSDGALIIFNVYGESCSLTNMDMEPLADYNVIFNFPEAKTVRINGIAVRGGILAPNADIVDATGVVWGPVYVKSLTGPLQINWKPLSSCDGKVLCEDDSDGAACQSPSVAGFDEKGSCAAGKNFGKCDSLKACQQGKGSCAKKSTQATKKKC